MNEPAGPLGGRLFDTTLALMLVLLLALAGIAYLRGGSPLVGEGLARGWALLLRLAPVIAVSLLAAGFADQLLPRDSVRS